MDSIFTNNAAMAAITYTARLVGTVIGELVRLGATGHTELRAAQFVNTAGTHMVVVRTGRGATGTLRADRFRRLLAGDTVRVWLDGALCKLTLHARPIAELRRVSELGVEGLHFDDSVERELEARCM